MLKATGRTGDGRDLLILGLSGENVTRLMADEPISLELSELGLPPIQLVIVGGRTEEDILHLLRSRYPTRSAPGTTDGFVCPACGRSSSHPEDKQHGYCGACQAFTGPNTAR